MWGRAFILLSVVCVNASALSFPDQDCKGFWAPYQALMGDKALDAAIAKFKRSSWLESASLSEQEALVALSFSEGGRDLLVKFLPLYQAKRVVFRSLHSPESLAKGLDPSTSAGGYSNGVIYVDEKASLLEYVTVFAHEATHAVEWLGSEEGVREAQWLSGELKSSQELARAHALLVRSEHHAFRFQDRFMRDLSKLDSDFQEAIALLVEQKKAFPFPMSQRFFSAMMVSGYGVPQSEIDSYFLNHSY